MLATRWRKYFDVKNPGLRAYFRRSRAGSNKVIRTTLFKNQKPQEVLKKWMAQIEVLEKDFPTLLQFEKDLSKKVGPMSVMKPLAQRMKDIDSYYQFVFDGEDTILGSAIDATLDEWSGLAGLRLRSQASTVENMRLSTNSGSPFFTKRRDVLRQTVPCRVEYGVDHDASRPTIVQNLGITTPNHSLWRGAAVLGWRGQEGGPNPEDVKQRSVWMFPFAVNVAELQVYQPLIEGAQKLKLVPAWVSMDEVDIAITKLFDTKPKNDLVVCTDFTAFDQHFGEVLQDAAKELLTGLLTPGERETDWLDDVFEMKYWIPLAYDWKRIRFGRHGMASGSGGTNCDETLVHRALQHEAAIYSGQELNPYSQCLGDDGLLTFPGITVDKVVDVYTQHGLEMNTTKQYASATDCEYLRRWHHVDYRVNGIMVGVYSTARALGRLMYQERYYDPKAWGPEQVALRQLSILENVKYHPLREQFVAFCMKGDKFRLGLDIPGFLDNVERIAQESMDNMPDFLGYTKTQQKATSIADWWIVQYLKSLA